MSYEYITTSEQFYQVLEKQIIPYYKSQTVPRWAVDLETFSLLDKSNEELYKVPKPIKLPPRAICNLATKQEFLMEYEGFSALFQLGADPKIFDKQWIFDIKKLGEKLITDNLKEIIESSQIIGHHIKYDVSFLITQFNIWPTKFLDTQLIDQILISGRKDETSLGENYKRYLDYGFFIAETGKNFYDYNQFKEIMQQSDWCGAVNKAQLQYAADDVRLIFFVYEEQKERIKKFIKRHPKSKIIDIIKLECSLITEFALLELRGIKFDTEYHNREVIPYLEQKAKEAYEKASAQFPDYGKMVSKGRGAKKIWFKEPINFASPKQVPEALASIGVKVPNAQEATLKAARHEHIAVQHILNYKKATYLLNNFGYKLPRFVHEDGKIHPNFRQIGTETGRLSGNNPNMQQIPARENLFGEMKASELCRKVFIAEDECDLIDSDYNTIEPRLIAQVSGDVNLIEAFKNNVDYHGFTAKNLLGLDKTPERGTHEREVIGKVGNLAMGYLAGDEKTARIMYVETLDEDEPIVWTPEEAHEKKEAYFNAIPQVREKINKTRAKVYQHFEVFESLEEFKGRRPVFTAFTENKGRHRSWYLTEKQEELARFPSKGDPREHPLHRDFKILEEYIDKKTGEKKYRESNYNQYRRMVSSIARESYNYLIQAESANILKRSVYILGEKFRLAGFDVLTEGLLLTVHDELLIQVKKEHTELAIRLVNEAMKEAGAEVLTKVPVSCEAHSGNSWYSAK